MEKKLLFVCVANSCRSQMAEAVAKKRFPSFLIDSCGQNPGYQIDSGVRDYLEPKGYDLSGQRPKGFSEVLPVADYDAIVILCAESCVIEPEIDRHPLVEKWNLSDPTGSVGEGREQAYGKLFQIIDERLTALQSRLA